MQRDDSAGPEHLTCAVDVFALGLMTHVYLTGELPHHDKRYGSPADAVNAGEQLDLDTRLSDEMLGLLRGMTARAPGGRPRMDGFLKALSDPKVCALQHRRPSTAKPKSPSAKTSSAKTPSAKPASAPGTAKPSGPRTSRIKTNLASSPRPRASTPPPEPTGPATGDAKPAAPPATPPTAPAPSAPDTSAERPSRVRINLGDRRPRPGSS
jgi:hypothetical protein